MDEVDPKYQKLADTIDIFSGLQASDVRKIFSKGMTLTVKSGDTLFHKGTVGSQLYVVLGGMMGVFDGPVQVATLRTGDTFGEMSLLRQEPRSATVKALEPSRLFVLSESVFQRILTKRVAIQILMNLTRMLGKRLAEANLLIREKDER